MSFPTDPNKYNVFVFYTGYVESNAASPVVISMSRDHQFPEAATWQEAWEMAFLSLQKVFLKALRHENNLDEDGEMVPKPCCAKALAKKKVPKFCDECGSNLASLSANTFPDDPEERQELVYEFLRRLKTSTYDSLGGDLWELTDNLGWVIPGHIDLGYVTFVHSESESLLANYHEEKETYKWDKALNFWGDSTVDIGRLVSPRDKVISVASDSEASSTKESVESDT